ncbi:hypothetical protein BY458DRAFT_495654 [Sporodiniella umbellata]|nr:hypothetical protein BY458DRAFT_495654 [Sporodiniella umbellata]
MTSAKLVQISKDIDTSRCNGSWSAIPDLARRYKKYNLEGTILEQTILAEASLSEITANSTTAKYQEDEPGKASFNNRLEPEQVKPIQQQLKNAIETVDTDNSHSLEKEFAKVVLARSYFECGEYNKALGVVQDITFTKDSVTVGYGLVLLLQSNVIKAICYEMIDDLSLAFENYEAVDSLVVEYSNIKSRTWIEWSETALYRAVLLGIKNDKVVKTSSLLEFIRQYQKITSTQPNDWRIEKRTTLTRHALRFSSNCYRNGLYVLPANANIEGDGRRQMFITEQSQLHTIYEKLLYLQVPLPKAGQVNRPVLDFVDQLASDFELIGTTSQDLRGFREVLDRASQRTFNSPSIARHLFLALCQLGEYHEAEYALRSYLHLVGLISHGWEEGRTHGEALAVDRNGISMPVTTARADIPDEDVYDEHDSIGNIKDAEGEEATHMLQVLMAAIKMYCNELTKGVDAVEMAEIAKELYQKHRKSVPQEAAAYLHRAIGVAYGLLGCQTFDPEVRPTYHEKAIFYIKQSLEIDNESWETHYQLALQQAEMHDIGHAIQSITKALQINSSHLPSWHLLTLIVSCPVQGDFKQALKTCEIGLQQIELKDDHDESEQFMLFQITRTWLLYALNGPESALSSSETLFSSFNKMSVIPEASQSGGHDMILSGSFGNLSELQNPKKSNRERSSSSTSNVSRSNEISAPSLRSGRARSASNLASKVSAGLLSVQENGSVKHHHHHGLHLFGSRSTSRHSKGVESPHGSTNTNISNQSLPTEPYDTKTNNSVSSFQSMTTSITSFQSILQPSYIPTKPSARAVFRRQRFERILSDLWLLTAQLFMKLNKLDEAKKAVEEAEHVDWTQNSMVWCVLGQLLLASKSDIEEVQAAFDKALVIDPYHAIGRLELAKSYLLQENDQMAEGLLDTLTKTNGWDCAEAWFLLGEIYKKTERIDRTKACLFYALELESTTPIQPFSILPRFI